MRGRREDLVALKFGDMITALIETLELTLGEFCERYGLSRCELGAIQEGVPVEADIALRLASALAWTPRDIDAFLEESGPVPLKNGARIVHARRKIDLKKTAAVEVVVGEGGRPKPGTVLRAYADPVSNGLERVYVDQPMAHVTQAFLDEHFLGLKWTEHYSDEYVDTMIQAIRTVARGAAAPKMWGLSSDGSPASMSFSPSDALVEIRYDIHESNICPIDRSWSFGSIWRGRAEISRGK